MAYELKTKKNEGSVTDFVNSVKDEQRKKDAKVLLKIFKEVTKKKPKMWGTSIIGYDTYSYVSKSGIKGEWMVTGFSPRKQNLSLYIISGFKNLQKYLDKLGKHKKSVGCLYINKLDDVDVTVLKKIIKESYAHMKKHGMGSC